MENCPPIESETKEVEKKNIQKSKEFLINTESKEECNITFENCGSYVKIIAELNESNVFKKIKYQQKFDLKQIQKVKYFLQYDELDECLEQIYAFIEDKKYEIKESNNILKLKIFLNSIKFPEISFDLEKMKIPDSEKIEDIFKIITKQQKQIEELQKAVMNNNYLKEKENENLVTSIDFSVIDKKEIKNYSKKEDKPKKMFLRFIFGVKDIKDLKKTKNFIIENKNILNEMNLELIENDDDNIVLESSELDVNDEKSELDKIKIQMITNFISYLKSGNISFKSGLIIKHIIEADNTDIKRLFNKLSKFELEFEGVKLNFNFISDYVLKFISIVNYIISLPEEKKEEEKEEKEEKEENEEKKEKGEKEEKEENKEKEEEEENKEKEEKEKGEEKDSIILTKKLIDSIKNEEYPSFFEVQSYIKEIVLEPLKKYIKDMQIKNIDFVENVDFEKIQIILVFPFDLVPSVKLKLPSLNDVIKEIILK